MEGPAHQDARVDRVKHPAAQDRWIEEPDRVPPAGPADRDPEDSFLHVAPAPQELRDVREDRREPTGGQALARLRRHPEDIIVLRPPEPFLHRIDELLPCDDPLVLPRDEGLVHGSCDTL